MVENAEVSDQLDVMKSIPADDSSEQEVESLWRQLMIHESFSSSELAEAKAKRIAAEATRQQTEIESVRSTKTATERMRHKAELAVKEANNLRDEATTDRSEAAAELKKAVTTRELAESQIALTAQDAETKAVETVKIAEVSASKTADNADEQAKMVIGDATKQADTILAEARTQAKEMSSRAEEKAREVVDTARATAEGQTTQLRRQALREIRSVMSHIQEMGAAATEELETQRILTNVAQMRVSADRAAGEVADQDEDWISSLGLTGSLDEVAPSQEPAPETAPVANAENPTSQETTNKASARRAKAKKS
jgi:hypothetical protein